MATNISANLSIRASHPSSALRSLKLPSVGQDYISSDDDIIVSSQSSDIEYYGIAGRIWEAAYVMAIYLGSTTILEFDPQCSIGDSRSGAVVELGAGNGFLGLKMARILLSRPEEYKNPIKSLVLTDAEAVCPLLKRNCLNGFPKATELHAVNLLVQPLEWGNLDHGWRLADRLASKDSPGISELPNGLLTHIVCSDLVYFPELFAPLLRSLLQLSSPPFSTVTQPVEIIISYMIRSLPKETPFWSAFGSWFDFSPVQVRHKSSSIHWEQFGDMEDGIIFVFVATRKPETLSWSVPDDLELMRRGNDAFETLLLRNMYHRVAFA